jgi:4-carboxymuconolactone decarboxylase
MSVSAEEAFRRLTIGETAVLARDRPGGVPLHCRLDGRTASLVHIGALVAVGAPASSYRAAVEAAMRNDVRLDDLLGVLVAVAETVGTARVIEAAPTIAMAAGYDVEAALERNDAG